MKGLIEPRNIESEISIDSLDDLGMRKLFQLIATIIYRGSGELQRALKNTEIHSFIAGEPLKAWTAYITLQHQLFLKSNLYQTMQVSSKMRNFALNLVIY